jgi:hypothetical protein
MSGDDADEIGDKIGIIGSYRIMDEASTLDIFCCDWPWVTLQFLTPHH